MSITTNMGFRAIKKFLTESFEFYAGALAMGLLAIAFLAPVFKLVFIVLCAGCAYMIYNITSTEKNDNLKDKIKNTFENIREDFRDNINKD